MNFTNLMGAYQVELKDGSNYVGFITRVTTCATDGNRYINMMINGKNNRLPVYKVSKVKPTLLSI